MISMVGVDIIEELKKLRETKRMISENLKEAKFIVCQKNLKNPLCARGEDWNKKLINYDEANVKLQEGFNIGLVCGQNNFICFDDDTEEGYVTQKIEALMQRTYKERTISGGTHIIFRFEGDKLPENKKLVLEGQDLGELRCYRQYVLISPSIAKDEKKGILEPKPYSVIEDNPVILISAKDIEEIISGLTSRKETLNTERDESRSGLEYRKVIALLREGKTREQIYETMRAYSKWKEGSEAYRSLTFEKAENFVLQEKENPILKTERVNTKPLDKEVLTKVKTCLMKYIDTSKQNIEILSLWLIGTYFHNQFEAYPLLQLLAQKRSGKTRTLKLLSSLCKGSDGSVSTSPTETSLFRHKEGALFFDEMESISRKERGAFRETLNAVYKKGNKIIRYKEVKTKGVKEYVEESFCPYYPLALANISGLGDVLGDRAVQVILRRSNKSLTKLVEDFRTNKEVLTLKNELESIEAIIPQGLFSKWNDFIETGEITDPNLQELFQKVDGTKIYGRALELFFPLFVISYLCGDIDCFLETAKEYTESKEEEEAADDIDENLKVYLSKRIDAFSSFVSSASLLQGFRQSLESPEEWVNSKWFGRALKRLDMIAKKRLVEGKTQVLLKLLSNNNSTNSTNTTNTTNSTNSTKPVELVEYVDKIEIKTPIQDSTNSILCPKCGKWNTHLYQDGFLFCDDCKSRFC